MKTEKCQGCGGTGFYAPNALGPDACIDCGGSGWSVRPAWTQGRDGNPKRCGWHLMHGNEWAQTFPSKKDAQSEADRRNKTATDRFFMDHGLWHDRETGQHIYTEDQHVAALESLADEAWSALEAAGVPRDGVRTLGESIRQLAAIAKGRT